MWKAGARWWDELEQMIPCPWLAVELCCGHIAFEINELGNNVPDCYRAILRLKPVKRVLTCKARCIPVLNNHEAVLIFRDFELLTTDIARRVYRVGGCFEAGVVSANECSQESFPKSVKPLRRDRGAQKMGSCLQQPITKP